MILPDKFRAEIQSKTLSITTRVIIKAAVGVTSDYCYNYITEESFPPPSEGGPTQTECNAQGDSIWVMGEETDIMQGAIDYMYLSTHSLNFDGNYYQPLLLNIPSIKESVSLESRKFKISNVTLNISNYKNNYGTRFSDILKETSINNKEVEIYWQTQGAISSSDSLMIFKGIVRRVKHDDVKVTVEVEDLTQSKFHKELPTKKTSKSGAILPKYRNKHIPMVYGHIDNAPTVIDVGNIIKADSEPIRLVTSNSEGLYTHHHLWGGFEELSQVQNSTDYSDGVPALKMISDDILMYIPRNTMATIDGEISLVEPGVEQWNYIDDVDIEGQVKLKPITVIDDSNEVRGVLLETIVTSKSSDVSCYYRVSGETYANDGNSSGWNTPNRLRAKVTEKLADFDYTDYDLSSTQLNGFAPQQGVTGSSTEDDYFYFTYNFSTMGSNRCQTMIRPEINCAPVYDNVGLSEWLQVALTGFKIPAMSDAWNVWGHVINLLPYPEEAGIPSGSNFRGGSAYPTNNPVFGISDTINEWCTWSTVDTKFKDLFHFIGFSDDYSYTSGSQSWIYEGATGDNIIEMSALLLNPEDILDFMYSPNSPFIQIVNNQFTYGHFSISIGYHLGDIWSSGEAHFSAMVDGKWGEIDIVQSAHIEHPYKKDFYLNVIGRFEEYEEEYQQWFEEAGGGGSYQTLIHTVTRVIENPISIIKDIAIIDLGLTQNQIDSDSYSHAALWHEGSMGKFGFSVNKKIESKKLIEDIAKSTLCYPYFKNNGKLAFPSYQDNYLATSWYSAIKIEDKHIISYSFDKTKLEKVYTKVEFSYNYDYISEEYQSDFKVPSWFENNSLFPTREMTEEELKYYGYEDVEDNVLKFECPYIRDEETAFRTSGRLFEFYKNQYLIIKLKLPLSYIELEVGSIVKFEELIGGIFAYGKDYTKVNLMHESGNQWTYPLFFVTSVIKNLDSIRVEMHQIHQLWPYSDLFDGDNWATIGVNDDYTYWGGSSVDEEVEEEVAEITTAIAAGDVYKFSYQTFGLADGEENYPYGTNEPLWYFITGQYSQHCYIRHPNYEDYDGNGFAQGMYALFPSSSFLTALENQEGTTAFQSGENYDQLRPYDAQYGFEVRPHTQNYCAMIINHIDESGGFLADNFLYRYELRNQSEIGEEMSLAWEFVIVESGADLPKVYASPHGDTMFGSQDFHIINTSYAQDVDAPPMQIIYSSPHPILIEGESPSTSISPPSDPIFRDINNDGIVDILDAVQMINISLAAEEEYDGNADLNKDGDVNILDAVILVNEIMGDE